MDAPSLQGRSIRSRPIPPPWSYDVEALRAVEETVVHTQVARRDEIHAPISGPAFQTAMRPCLIRFLGDQDVDAVEALNEVVLARLPHPHILRREDHAYLARHIAERGRLIGAFTEDCMVAFTLLSFPRDDPDNLGIDLGFDRPTRLRSCHLELTGVHPDYRGSHLHSTMNEMRSRFAATAGYHHLYGTVSPRNPYSLANHLAAGMMVRKLVLKYGGMDRYVIYRDYDRNRVFAPGALDAAQYIPCHEIAKQRDILAEGFWGVSLRKGGGGEWSVGYVPSEQIGFQSQDATP